MLLMLSIISDTEDMKVLNNNLPKCSKENEHKHLLGHSIKISYIDRVDPHNLQDTLQAKQPVPQSYRVSTSKVRRQDPEKQMSIDKENLQIQC
jgi:hypothetical protein